MCVGVVEFFYSIFQCSEVKSSGDGLWTDRHKAARLLAVYGRRPHCENKPTPSFRKMTRSQLLDSGWG